MDLIGYRRHGHSEVDDPTITQPLLYKAIKDHPPLWEIYAERIGIEDVANKVESVRSRVRRRPQERVKDHQEAAPPRAAGLLGPTTYGGRHKPEYEVPTGLPREELSEITARLTSDPDGFHIHPKVKKLLEQRAEMGNGKRDVDYGMAEALAFGSRW